MTLHDFFSENNNFSDFVILAQLKIIESGEQSEIELTIHEGKFHQVKRMFESVGKKVVYLKRLSMGKLMLDENLGLGEYRELTDEEVKLIEER